MEEEFINIKNSAMSIIFEAKDLKELEEIKLQFLGRSGKLTLSIKEISKLPKEKRPEVGQLANEIKKTIENLIDEKNRELTRKTKEYHEQKTVDITMPGIKPPLGHLHLITQAIEEITSIFEHIGFTRVRYPEVEWDWYAFEALNFPENHPARDDWETFFIEIKNDKKYGPMLLTPHTSSGQIREMLSTTKSRTKGEGISIKMLNIAKCYRRQSDVSHSE